MHIATAGINAFRLFYMGGLGELPKPGKADIHLMKQGLKIRTFDPWKKLEIAKGNLISAEVSYEVIDKELSAGKAVVGGVLAGGVGAIAGASMGNKKVEATLIIKYSGDQGEEKLLVLTGRNVDVTSRKIKKKYNI